MTTRITIRKPDDWHLHVRDREMLKAVMPYTAKHFGRAILMQNLIPPGRRGRILRGSLRSHLRVTEQIAERV